MPITIITPDPLAVSPYHPTQPPPAQGGGLPVASQHWNALAGQVSDRELVSLEKLLRNTNLLGSGADLAFIVFALQIKQMDSQVAGEIKRVQQMGKLREAINGQLDKLRSLRALIESTKVDKDNRASINEILVAGNYATKEQTELLGKDEAATKAVLAAADRAYKELGIAKVTFDQNPQTGEVKTINGDPICHWEDGKQYISTTDVEKEEKRLEGLAQRLDSNREIQMIMLNQQLNKKEQAVTQLTNIIKKTHDTKSGIINNLK